MSLVRGKNNNTANNNGSIDVATLTPVCSHSCFSGVRHRWFVLSSLIILLFLLLSAQPANADTADLHPSGEGTGNDFSFTGAAASALDTNDGTSTYARSNSSGEYLYMDIDDPALTGTINSVTVYVVIENFDQWNDATFQVGLKTYSTNYLGSNQTAPDSFATRSGTTYATNPNTSSAWTWTEINDLVGIVYHTDWDDVWVTEMYVRVDYTAPSDPLTTVGTATATVNGTQSIDVTMPYTEDSNTDNTYTIEYKLSSDGSWLAWDNSVASPFAHTVSPYTDTITGLTTGETYDVRVTYVDGDGVNGTNPQTISSIYLEDLNTGLVVYGEGSVNTPRYRKWDGSAFGSEGSASSDSNTIRQIINRESPTVTDDYMMGAIHSNGLFYVQRYDGSTWTDYNNFNSSGINSGQVRFADIAYEKLSGDAVTVYENSGSGNRTIAYRTWDGSSWSSQQSLDYSGFDGGFNVVYWVRLIPKANSNDMILVFVDSGGNVYAYVWDGSSWTNGNLFSSSASTVTREPIDGAWEGTSGDAMVAFGSGSNVRYSTSSGGTGAWTSDATAYSLSNTHRYVALGSDPNGNYIGAIASDNNNRAYVKMWNGSSWDGSEPSYGDLGIASSYYMPLDVAWENTGSKALFAWRNGSTDTQVKYMTYTVSGTTWSETDLDNASTTGVTWSGNMVAVRLKRDPLSASKRIMLTALSAGDDIRSQLWNDGVWSEPTNYFHETNSPEATHRPFMFAWEESTPPNDGTLAGTATATAASPTTIAVSMPYLSDDNNDNTYTVDYKLSSAGSWVNWVTGDTHTATPYTTTITGLVSSLSYDVRVTYVDPDGVTGTNPQTFTGIIPVADNTGLAAYGDGNNTGWPKRVLWDGSDYSSEEMSSSQDASNVLYHRIVKESPVLTNQFAIGGVYADGKYYLQQYDGTTWTDYGDSSTLNVNSGLTRHADIAFEQSSGDGLTVFDYDSNDDQALAYRIWNGSSWGINQGLDYSGLTGSSDAEVRWVKLIPKQDSDEILLVFVDSNEEVFAYVWDGSTFTNGGNITTNRNAQTSAGEVIAGAWEGTTGDAMVIFGNNNNGISYSTSAGGTGAWTSDATIFSFPWDISGTPSARFVAAAGDRDSDYIGIIVSDTLPGIWVRMWTGSAWEGSPPNERSFLTGQPRAMPLDVAWQTTGSKALFAWSDGGTQADYITYTVGSGWSVGTLTSASTTTTTWSGSLYTIQLVPDPLAGSKRIMLTGLDSTTDVQGILWDDGSWTEPSNDEYEQNLMNVSYRPAMFAWDNTTITDSTAPIAGTVTTYNTSFGGTYVDSPFDLAASFQDLESPVISCQYTKDGGSNWFDGTVSGAGPYTCTATGITGSDEDVLALNIKATSLGGTVTATVIARTVDALGPTDGTLSASAGDSSVELTWTEATDSASGMVSTDTYKLVFATGSTPADCDSGTEIYLGTDLAYSHGSLTNGTTYYYRVCAYDNVTNVSSGAIDNATPTPDATPPVAGTVTPTSTDYLSTYVDSPFNLTTDFTDAGSAVTSCDYTEDGSTWSPGVVSGSDPTYTCTTTDITGSDEDSLTLNMRGFSSGGVTTASSVARTMDVVAPTTTSSASGGYTFGNWTTASPVGVTLSATDKSPGSGLASTSYCVDTANTCTPGTSYTVPFNVSCSAGATCIQYVRYASVDNVTNTETTVSKAVKQDTQGPADGTLTAMPDNTFNVLTWTAATDSGVGLASSNRYKLVSSTSGTPADCTGTAVYQGNLLTYTDTPLTNETTYYYRLCAYDDFDYVSTGTTDDATPTPADITDPSDVDDFAATPVYTRGAKLSWTAPGDDNTTGTASSYDVRFIDAWDYSANVTAAYLDSNWASLTQATGEPTPQVSGSSESFNLALDTDSNNLKPNTIYYLAIKSLDDWDNVSAISNAVAMHTAMKYGYNTVSIPYDPSTGTTYTLYDMIVDDVTNFSYYPSSYPLAYVWTPSGLDSGSLFSGSWSALDQTALLTSLTNGKGLNIYAFAMNTSILDEKDTDDTSLVTTNTDNWVSISLSQGRNLVGDPYLKNVNFSDIKICKDSTFSSSTGCSGGTVNGFVAAVSASWMDGTIAYYANSTTYSTETCSGVSCTAKLRPWWAQWVYLLKDDGTYIMAVPEP